MRVAVIGSRSKSVPNLNIYLPVECTELVSGGATGVDYSARLYAKVNRISITEFLPDYSRFGRYAPLRRNDQIIEYSDMVIAFWDGESRGTKYVINRCKKLGKPMKIIRV